MAIEGNLGSLGTNDILLKCQFPGDSNVSDVAEAIEIVDWHTHYSHPTGASVSQGDVSSGRTQHGHFVFRKRVDSTTPLFLRQMWKGRTLEPMTFHFFSNGEPVMEIHIEEAKIANLTMEGSQANVPIEEYQLAYGKITMKQISLDFMGMAQGTVPTSHDLKLQIVE